jgi:hypothetical protein
MQLIYIVFPASSQVNPQQGTLLSILPQDVIRKILDFCAISRVSTEPAPIDYTKPWSLEMPQYVLPVLFFSFLLHSIFLRVPGI